MIKIEDCIFASPEQMEFVIMGMRNPKNSWSKSDSKLKLVDETIMSEIHLGEADLNLMQRLSKAGSEHRKYLRMLPVWCNITAPLYWWKEFDTYKIGTVSNSCSTMHKIAEKEFTLADFSIEHLNDDRSAELSNVEWLEHLIHHLNRDRLRFIETKDKQYWWQLIQLLPSSYNQKRSIFMNGEVLLNIYNQRWGHKLDEWREFCFFIEDCPYWDFIEPGVLFRKVKGE